MSDNVGLSTPRGSGTSGYVQRNLAHLRPRDSAAPYPQDLDSLRHRQRQPDRGILEHDRKRAVEVEVFELRDQLEDEGYDQKHPTITQQLPHLLTYMCNRVDEDEIEAQCQALRKKLLAGQGQQERRGGGGRRDDGGASSSSQPPKKGLKMHQVHELADAKIKESERLRRALKISKDYEEGGHWRRQEERQKSALLGGDSNKEPTSSSYRQGDRD